MPWRAEKDPYKVWISEIMLQQTRVEQATGYYIRFLGRFPTVAALAEAPEVDVLKHWEGLGYNSRARNLHAAAKQIVDDLAGVFPDHYEALLKLKGIGPYTASAVASFAFGEARPVIDTNVVRIVCRLLGLDAPIDLPSTQATIKTQVEQWFVKAAPARFNQAIMDFGALQCLPNKPNCSTCPFSTQCVGYQQQIQDNLPVKPPKKARKPVHFTYLVISTPTGLYLTQRKGNDIWKGMYTFVEADPGTLVASLQCGDVTKQMGATFQVAFVSDTYRQTLTHRQVEAVFLVLKPTETWLPPTAGVTATALEIKKSVPVPGIIREFLNNFDAAMV
jgi:A/G-specific adenine glycosylase